MRRFFSLSVACTFITLTIFAHGQEIDIAGGGSELLSFKPTSASLAYPPPAEKGGIFVSASVQRINDSHRGLNVEIAVREKQGLYNGFQNFRPALYDVNAVFERQVRHKFTADFMAGLGGQTVIFYNHFNTCTASSGVCIVNVNSTHFLVDAAADLRYNFWKKFFVRPEVHYYYVIDNSQFHSGNLLRAGVSVGYAFGR